MIDKAFFPPHRHALWLMIGLLAVNLLAWGWALMVFHHTTLIGAALLAYGYGLRHAVDADHIAAIDNVTRKLMQRGQRPVMTGAFFSLGHSSIVILACVAIAATSLAFSDKIGWLHDYGNRIGTLVSALFLLLMGLLNAMILRDIYRHFKKVTQGETFSSADSPVVPGGMMSRIFGCAFNMVNKSWQMYLVGFLFGLGFDTATEISLLGISAAGSSSGMSIWNILVFPALFASGMTLVDSLDNFVMVGAYGWAFDNPLRKLYYNMTITATSVVIALLIGGLEALGLMSEKLDLHDGFWGDVERLNGNMGSVGYAAMAIFVVFWGISALNYYRKGALLNKSDFYSGSRR